jgi:Rod binding domain-containing protein
MDSKNSLQLAKMKNSAQETRDYAFKMEAVKKNLMPPVDKEKKLRESCEGFESIFIQKMWEQMRATIPESGFLKGREEKFWQSMYDQELAKTMAGAGGIGLADMMYEQLSQSLRSVSKNTADARGGRPAGFAAELSPAPLLPTAQPQAKKADAGPEASARQQKSSALSGLYAEARQPGVLPDDSPREAAPPQAAVQPASGVAATRPKTEAETNPAIMAVLNELRNTRPAGAATDGQQAAEARGQNLGARPPLPAMEGNSQPSEHQGNAYISTLARPVHKPISGKRSVMPRAASGRRVPSGQPVNRNLPFTQQASQQTQVQTQAQSQIQNAFAAQPATAASIPGPAASGNNSPGVEALNAFAAQQKASQLVPGAGLPGVAATDTPKTGG